MTEAIIQQSEKEVNKRFYKLPEDLLNRRDLTLTAKVVFAVLLRRQGGNEEAWTGYKRLADDIGISKMSAIRAVQELEKLGLIEVTARGGGTKNPNHYKISETVTNCDRSEIETVTKSDSSKGERVTNCDREQPQNVTDNGNKLLHERVTICDRNRDIQERHSKETIKKEMVEIPSRLLSLTGFQVAWDEWIEYRRERRLTVTPRCLKKQLAFLEDQIDPIAVINKSITNGWQGLDFGTNQQGKRAYIPAKPAKSQGQDMSGSVLKNYGKEAI